MRPARQRDAVVSNFKMVKFVVPGLAPGIGVLVTNEKSK
jgi:hypothetical protein